MIKTQSIPPTTSLGLVPTAAHVTLGRVRNIARPLQVIPTIALTSILQTKDGKPRVDAVIGAPLDRHVNPRRHRRTAQRPPLLALGPAPQVVVLVHGRVRVRIHLWRMGFGPVEAQTIRPAALFMADTVCFCFTSLFHLPTYLPTDQTADFRPSGEYYWHCIFYHYSTFRV